MLGFDLNGFLSQLLMPLKGVLAGNSLFGGLLTVFLICSFLGSWDSRSCNHGTSHSTILGYLDCRKYRCIQCWNKCSEHAQYFYRAVLAMVRLDRRSWDNASFSCTIYVSKSKYLKSLGRLSILPGLFNINEPMIFGAPIVMNPVLGIPFIVAPLVTTTLSYILTVSGVVPMMVARLPFAMPAPIAAWMSTNWRWQQEFLLS